MRRHKPKTVGRHTMSLRHATGLSHTAHRVNRYKRDMVKVMRARLNAQLREERHELGDASVKEGIRSKISATLRAKRLENH